MKLKLRHSVPPEMLFPMVSLFSKIGLIRFYQKTLDVRRFDQILQECSCFLHNSSLEGVMKLNFVPFSSF